MRISTNKTSKAILVLFYPLYILIIVELLNRITKNSPKKDYKDTCLKLIIKTRLQAPKSKSQIWTEANWGSATLADKQVWKRHHCSTILSLYDAKVLGYDDILPEGVDKSVLTYNQQLTLFNMSKALMEHLVKANITFSPVFGTLLGIARNGVAMLPWDDDIDFAIEDTGNLTQKLTEGLKFIGSERKAKYCFDNKDVWELPGGWRIFRKKDPCGMPWKIHAPGKGYPAIDMNTFKRKVIQDQVMWVTPEHELDQGHLHKFEKPAIWFGSMQKTITVPFSTDISDRLKFPVPDDSLLVLKDDYGNEGLTNCQPSYTHNTFCSFGNSISCENSMANHLARLKFPCVLLPAKFHGMALANETGYMRDNYRKVTL